MGYGKEKPKNVRKKLTEKYPWLKEGDVLSEEFILKQSKEHQVENHFEENYELEEEDQLVCYGLYKNFMDFWKAL